MHVLLGHGLCEHHTGRVPRETIIESTAAFKLNLTKSKMQKWGWYTSRISALRRQRQEDYCKFDNSLVR